MGLFGLLKKWKGEVSNSITVLNDNEISAIAEEIVTRLVGDSTSSDAETEAQMEKYENPIYSYYIDLFHEVEPKELNNTGYSFNDIRAVVNDGDKTTFYLLHGDNIDKARNDLLCINMFIEEARQLAPTIGLNYLSVDKSLNFEPVKGDMKVSNNRHLSKLNKRW